MVHYCLPTAYDLIMDPILNDEEIVETRLKSSSLPESSSPDSGQSATSNPSVKRLQMVILELLETEALYLQNLRELEDGYLNPLRADPEFDETVLNVAFQVLPRLRAFHEFFYASLNDCRWNLCNLACQFIQYAPQLEALYSDFCVNLGSSLHLVQSIWRDRPLLAAKLSQCQQNLGHKLTVDSYLTKPFQRILRYQLLLKELLKFGQDAMNISLSDKSSPDSSRDSFNMDLGQQARSSLATINQALDKIIKVGDSINEGKRRRELVDHLQAKYPEVANMGALLLTDEMHVSIKKGIRLTLLFEKAVLLCKRIAVPSSTWASDSAQSYVNSQTRLSGSSGESTLVIQRVMNICNIILTENVPKEQPNTFRLIPMGQQKESLLFRTLNVETKRKWCEEIRRLILETFGSVVPEKALRQLMAGVLKDDEGIEQSGTKYASRMRARSRTRDRLKYSSVEKKVESRSKSSVDGNRVVQFPTEDIRESNEPQLEKQPSLVPSDTRARIQSPITGSELDDDSDVVAHTIRNRNTMLSKLKNVVRSKKRLDNESPIIPEDLERRKDGPSPPTKTLTGEVDDTSERLTDFAACLLNDPRVFGLPELTGGSIADRKKSSPRNIHSSHNLTAAQANVGIDQRSPSRSNSDINSSHSANMRDLHTEIAKLATTPPKLNPVKRSVPLNESSSDWLTAQSENIRQRQNADASTIRLGFKIQSGSKSSQMPDRATCSSLKTNGSDTLINVQSALENPAQKFPHERSARSKPKAHSRSISVQSYSPPASLPLPPIKPVFLKNVLHQTYPVGSQPTFFVEPLEATCQPATREAPRRRSQSSNRRALSNVCSVYDKKDQNTPEDVLKNGRDESPIILGELERRKDGPSPPTTTLTGEVDDTSERLTDFAACLLNNPCVLGLPEPRGGSKADRKKSSPRNIHSSHNLTAAQANVSIAQRSPSRSNSDINSSHSANMRDLHTEIAKLATTPPKLNPVKRSVPLNESSSDWPTAKRENTRQRQNADASTKRPGFKFMKGNKSSQMPDRATRSSLKTNGTDTPVNLQSALEIPVQKLPHERSARSKLKAHPRSIPVQYYSPPASLPLPPIKPVFLKNVLHQTHPVGSQPTVFVEPLEATGQPATREAPRRRSQSSNRRALSNVCSVYDKEDRNTPEDVLKNGREINGSQTNVYEQIMQCRSRILAARDAFLKPET